MWLRAATMQDTCPYFSGRHIAQQSREIYVDACGCMDAATCVGIDFSFPLGDTSPRTVRKSLLTHVAPCCHAWLHAAASIGTYVPTVLGDTSPSKVITSMPMRVAPWSHRPCHRFTYFSGRHIAQTSRDISVGACDSVEPHALTLISLLSGQHIAQ